MNNKDVYSVKIISSFLIDKIKKNDVKKFALPCRFNAF